jgi:hypothetical protein
MAHCGSLHDNRRAVNPRLPASFAREAAKLLTKDEARRIAVTWRTNQSTITALVWRLNATSGLISSRWPGNGENNFSSV